MDVAALNSRVVLEMKPVQVMVGKKDGNNADGKEVGLFAHRCTPLYSQESVHLNQNEKEMLKET